MKKMILALTVGLMTSAVAFADEGDTGALGFGVISESSQGNGFYGGGIRGSLYLDAGAQLFGPFHYGFELQGDIKKLDQNSSAFSVTDVATYWINPATYVVFINSQNFTQTYTLWDADISPRGYVSFDLGNKIQLLGFAGLNYNWQTLEYKLTSDTPFTDPDGNTGVTSYRKAKTFGDNWSAVAGVRVSVGAFYLDYTRFLQANANSDLAWDQYNKDRWGLGISLRF